MRFVGTAQVLIKSGTHYNQLGYDENAITDVTIAAKTLSSYANGIRVSIIDAKADQILTVADGTLNSCRNCCYTNCCRKTKNNWCRCWNRGS